MTAEVLGVLYDANPCAFDQPMDLGDGKKRLPVATMTYNRDAPHDAFRFLMDKAKPMKDPYDYYLELRLFFVPKQEVSCDSTRLTGSCRVMSRCSTH